MAETQLWLWLFGIGSRVLARGHSFPTPVVRHQLSSTDLRSQGPGGLGRDWNLGCHEAVAFFFFAFGAGLPTAPHNF